VQRDESDTLPISGGVAQAFARLGPAPVPTAAPLPVLGLGLRPLRLMVVEDEPQVARSIRDTVEDLGHRVCGIAHSEQEAILLADRERPDLALMDVRLAAGGDGIMAARRLAAGYGIRSIFLSGYADHGTMRQLTETYPLGVVHKPFSTAQLKSALDLAGRRLRLRP